MRFLSPDFRPHALLATLHNQLTTTHIGYFYIAGSRETFTDESDSNIIFLNIPSNVGSANFPEFVDSQEVFIECFLRAQHHSKLSWEAGVGGCIETTSDLSPCPAHKPQALTV